MAYIKDVQVGSDVYLIEPALYIAPSKNGAAYTATLTNFSLVTGATVQAKFAATNDANATLNVNSTGAKEIHYNGAKITASQFKVNHVYTLVYDGTQWQVVGDIDTNTWRGIENSLTSDSTSVSLSAAQGKALKGLIDAMDATTPAASGNATAFIDSITQTDGKITSITKKNIPTVSSSTAGLAPKGAAVSTQSTSTKFLREDGTWAAPSYIANTDAKVAQSSNDEDKEFPIILKNTNNMTPETNGVKYTEGVTVNPSDKTVTAAEFIGNLKSDKIIPIASKTYPAYTLSADNADNGILFFGDVTISDTTVWQTPWAVHYRLYVSTSEAATQGWYDCYFSINGNTIMYYNYNNFYSTSYRPIYQHGLLYPNNGQSTHGAHLGMRVYSSRTPTTLARIYKVELLEQINCTVTLRDNLAKYSELKNTTYYTYGEYNATSQGLQESGDTNSNDTASGYIRDAGSSQATIKVAEQLHAYLIMLPDGDGITYHPINGANKDLDTDKDNIYNGDFNITQKIYYYPTDATVSENGAVRQDRLWLMYAFNLRYSFNIGDTLTVGKEVYMVASLQSSTTATLRNPEATGNNASAQATGANAGPITQTLPTSEDGFIYIYLGRAYTVNTITLAMDHPIYWFKDGELRLYTGGRGLKSITRSGTTFTVTRDDGSTFDFTQQDTNKYHKSGSWGGTNNLTYTATAVNSADALAFTLETASTSVYGATKLSSATDSDSEVLAATPKAIKTLNTKMDGLLAAANAMTFKGVINATNALPNSHNAGDTYRIGTAGTYPIVDSNGRYCEVGTLIICITDGTAANAAHWTAVETNEDGAVIGPSPSTDNAIARFDGATGRIIQDSKVTIDDNGCITLTHTEGKSEELSIKYGSTIDYWWGVGTGNENHGLYDVKVSKWILSAGEDNSWSFTGNAHTATTATNLSAKPLLKASGNNITVTAGGKTSDAFTVPYATSAGTATSLTNFVVSTYTITASEGVRIKYPQNAPVLISCQRSTGGSRLILIGGGYGKQATVRNDFTEVVSPSESHFTWSMPEPNNDSYACTIEIMHHDTSGTATVIVQSTAVCTFTRISALTSTKTNRTLLNSSNYANYAAETNGSNASGTWGINITGSAGSVAWDNVSGRPTNVSSFTNDAGYLTSYTETDPTVPAWAKAASKPSYTASEVGALASSTVVTNVAISANVTTNANYPIIFATSDKDTTAPKEEGLQKNGAKFYFNPHTGNVVSTLFNNLTLTAATTGFTIAGGTTSKTLTVAGTATINAPTQWGIVYGGASGAYTSTAAGTSGQYLKSNGNAAPTWATFSASTVGLSNVTNDAQIPKSIGTTKGDIIYFDGNASPKRLAIGTNGEVLKIVSGIPSWETDNNDDTKNTAGSTNSDSKLYLIGAASQAANPQTYSDAHVFETNGAFSAKTLGVNADTDDDKVTLQWNSTDNSLDFVFA